LLFLAVAITAVAVAAGIGSAQSNALTGNVWVLTTLLGKAPLQGTELTSAFTAAGSVSGSAGCNHFGAKYTSSVRTLRISSIISTQMACAAKIMAQESDFLKALASARTFAVSGATLTLRSAAGRALLTYKAQSQQLVGTSWKVTGYNNGKQGVESVIAGATLTATFGKDGNLTGFAGCNSYNAPYKATSPRVTIGPVASTRKACATPKGVMDQELQYLTALHTAATYRIEGSRLELRTGTGALAAEFKRT
jgi:heat shock protein HslJ